MLWLYITLGTAGGLALIILFVWFNNSCLQKTYYDIAFQCTEEFKIVHLSDLHGKNFGKRNLKLIEKVSAEKPDVIVITGDIIHTYTQRNCQTAVEAVSQLKEIAPVLYVAGNHEMRNKGYRQLKKQLAEGGADVLDNASATVNGITFVGLNCASIKNDTVFKITPASSPKILLAHLPHYFEKYSCAGYDLVLCGHAHGGQWRIPFTGIGLYAPGQGKFPKYTSGVHKSGKTRMVISRGLGNSRCPLRLFNRPEIVVINCKPE